MLEDPIKAWVQVQYIRRLAMSSTLEMQAVDLDKIADEISIIFSNSISLFIFKIISRGFALISLYILFVDTNSFALIVIRDSYSYWKILHLQKLHQQSF